MQNSIHIIGAGMAGWQIAQDMRHRDENIQITIICADSGDFYNKILLSTMFEKNMTAQSLVTKTAQEKADELKINLLANTEVKKIDSANKRIILANGEQIEYKNLVLATGANPIQLPFLQNNPKVFFVNNLNDYKKFSQHIRPNTKIAILGAGLVGVEFAHDLLNSPAEVLLISDTPNILPTLAPEQISSILLQKMQAKGLQSKLGVSLTGIEDKNAKLILNFANGDSEEVDILLSAIGLQAETKLAESANCELENRAIKVNKQLQTSVENIYALGDCACIAGKNLMYLEPMQKSSKIIVKDILGEDAQLELKAMPVIVKSSIYPVVSVMPNSNALGDWQVESSETGVNAKFIDKNAKILGFALSGTEVRYANRLAKQLENLV